MPTNYSRGRAYEYRIRKKLLAEGFDHVLRTAGSHGVFDLIAIDTKKKEIRLVQCKSGKSKTTELKKLSFKEFIGFYWVRAEAV